MQTEVGIKKMKFVVKKYILPALKTAVTKEVQFNMLSKLCAY